MITGERVRFRGIERADIPTFVRWLNDPEVLQGILIHHPISQAGEEGWFENMIKRAVDEQVMGIEARVSPQDGGDGNWQLIGSLGFTHIDWRNRASEFGIMIGDREFWNRGYGSEAVRLLCRHGFETLNLNRISLDVFETNPRAIRAYEKAGFVHEGHKRQDHFLDGRYVDTLVMSQLKEEFRR